MAKIMGNIVGLPSPRSDWNQTDETKADYIKNKPLKEIQAMKSLQYYGDANIVPSDASLFGFTTDDATMTASIAAKSTDISGDIVIPYEYVNGDKNYKVVSVGGWGFNYSNISSARIPNSITNLGFEVFHTCENLTKVYYAGSKEQWDSIATPEANNIALYETTIHYCVPATKADINEVINEVKTKTVENGEESSAVAVLSNNLMLGYDFIWLTLNVTFDLPNFGDTAGLFFTTPQILPSDYTTFPKTVIFKGDSTEDGRFIPEEYTRYTMAFSNDGAHIIGYVSGVSLG